MIWGTGQSVKEKMIFCLFFLMAKVLSSVTLEWIPGQRRVPKLFCIKHQAWKPTSICTSGQVSSLVVGSVGNGNVKKITTFSRKTVWKEGSVPRSMETAQNWKNFEISCQTCWLDNSSSLAGRICMYYSYCNVFEKLFISSSNYSSCITAPFFSPHRMGVIASSILLHDGETLHLHETLSPPLPSCGVTEAIAAHGLVDNGSLN